MQLFPFFKKKPLFNEDETRRIVSAIRSCEQKTSGEIRVYIEAKNPYVSPLDRAIEVFAKLKMEQTEHRNGVLLYIAHKHHELALFGDTGIYEKAGKELKKGRLSSLSRNFPSGHFEDDYRAIINATLKGDQFAVELFSEAGYNIGRGVAILIHILNPEQIILSGRGSSAGKIWQAPIQQALNEHCIPRLAANTTIEISSLGYNAELVGAAALIMNNYDDHVARKNFAEYGSGILSGN